MADKKPAADNWPVVSGDYIVGDPESPVAVTTLASHNEDIPAAAGAAIACGAEVQGHITGQSIQALHENGCDPEKKKITGATGAIPFVENIPMEGVERFQQQVELVDMIDNEDGGAITAKVKECIEKDPGALEEDALVISLDEKNSKSAKVIDMSLRNKDVKIDTDA